jgi:serine/threonine-protein kinase
MELVDGGSLAARLRSNPLTAREAAEIVANVARAVQHAHERGVLHRDLKPANILLDSAGEPRVADFGLARIEGLDATLTHSGLVLGTPAYMSPEQATGKSKDLTTASDIYSLGAVLYELLTNRPPFTGNSSVAVLRRVAEEEPARPTTIKRGIDSDLETICMRCLEKEPTARYRSMLALAGDLERWLKGEPILARRVRAAERVWKWARRHPALTALWGAVAALIVVVAIVATALSFSLARYNRTVVASAGTLRHQLAREFVGKFAAAG